MEGVGNTSCADVGWMARHNKTVEMRIPQKYFWTTNMFFLRLKEGNAMFPPSPGF
jgi:hypothetical protein